jgi:chaperonin GroES
MGKVRPLADKVLVKPQAEEERTAGGIVLPDAAKEKPQKGTVVAVGEGRLLDNGTRVPASVKEGDTVVFSKYGGTEFKFEGEEYLLLDEMSLLAVVES